MWMVDSDSPKSTTRAFRFGHELGQGIANLRRILEMITKEGDFEHRRDMRETSQKIAEMQVEQHKMARMLHIQRILMESMQQESRLVYSVREQQKILHILQQIQCDMQTQSWQSSNMREPAVPLENIE
jgi:hypothetical protein